MPFAGIISPSSLSPPEVLRGRKRNEMLWLKPSWLAWKHKVKLSWTQKIAQTHHEKWDGSGYSKGLKGSKIPLAGRITAIADVFDALTSRRPYKEAFSLEKSYGIIAEGRGSHFDPDVVDAFFAIEDEMLEIKEKYKDEHESLFVKMVRNK